MRRHAQPVHVGVQLRDLGGRRGVQERDGALLPAAEPGARAAVPAPVPHRRLHAGRAVRDRGAAARARGVARVRGLVELGDSPQGRGQLAIQRGRHGAAAGAV